MLEELTQEGLDDVTQKTWCIAEQHHNEDLASEKEYSISQIEAKIERAEQAIKKMEKKQDYTRDRGPLAVRGEQRRLHPGAGEEEQAAGLRDRPGLRRAERPRVLGRGQPRERAALDPRHDEEHQGGPRERDRPVGQG